MEHKHAIVWHLVNDIPLPTRDIQPINGVTVIAKAAFTNELSVPLS